VDYKSILCDIIINMEKRSFFERLTGTNSSEQRHRASLQEHKEELPDVSADDEGQLTIDMWQTPSEIVVQTIVAGLKPDDVDVSISHEMVTIKGKRSKSHTISDSEYFYQELFWGMFSRSLLLPEEVDVEKSEASIKNGLLTIRLPKLDKSRAQKLKVKSE